MHRHDVTVPPLGTVASFGRAARSGPRCRRAQVQGKRSTEWRSPGAMQPGRGQSDDHGVRSHDKVLGGQARLVGDLRAGVEVDAPQHPLPRAAREHPSRHPVRGSLRNGDGATPQRIGDMT